MKKIFEKLSIKFFEFIYKKQDMAHKKRMEKLNKKILSGNVCGQKHHAVVGATLAISSEAKANDKANQEKIERIIEQYIDEPEKLFNYIKGAKTEVHLNKFAQKILAKINEQEGFILPQKGLKALYLNLLLNKKISFSTKEMFVLSSLDVNLTVFIYQFYKWYCYKMNLSGCEAEVQEQFKKVFEICETSKIDTLSYEEVLNLKSAIRRDIEAIDFVKKIVQKFSMAMKNLEKIKQGQSIRV